MNVCMCVCVTDLHGVEGCGKSGNGLCFHFPYNCDVYFFSFQHLQGLHELLLTRQGSLVELPLSFAKLRETQDLKLSGTKKERKSATRDLRY